MPSPGPSRAATVAGVVAAVDGLYDPGRAEPWDAVGLVCGDPRAPVCRVHLAVDPTLDVVDEAVDAGADLLLTHHPLLLRPVHSIAATSPKGAVLHRLVRAGVALLTAHTNADVAAPGVSDALADALGVVGTRPLDPRPDGRQDKLVTFAPVEAVDGVLDALAGAGAGAIGAYARCAFTSPGTGTFRPLPGARPTLGALGRQEQVPEVRIEMVLPRQARGAVLAALRAAHPYDEVAVDLYELAATPGPYGLGRVGVLPEPVPLELFASHVALALPETVGGVRVAGDPEALVTRVALCGGAGDSLIEKARAAGADAFVTADLRHHRVSEAREHAIDGVGMALVDVSHWASEWPWLPDAAQRLERALAQAGALVETTVSRLCTDPWTAHSAAGFDLATLGPDDRSPT